MYEYNLYSESNYFTKNCNPKNDSGEIVYCESQALALANIYTVGQIVLGFGICCFGILYETFP